jgi:hypothetical protein
VVEEQDLLMFSMPLNVRFFVATGTAALLVGGCSSSPDRAASTKSPEPSSAPATTNAPGESAAQQYLDAVNGLCEKLLPEVVRATHGGSLDVSARQYLADWPAHNRLLEAFDQSLAAVPVPHAATHAAAAMHAYVRFADRLDAARLAAAKAGERAWRREVAAEAGAGNDPTITARTAAGFDASCDAR